MSASNPQGSQKFWFGGLPVSAIQPTTNNVGTVKFWFNGLPVNQLLPPAGTAYSVSAAETATATESASGDLPLSPSISETATATDSATDTLQMSMTAADSAAVIDSVVGGTTTTSDVAESATVADGVAGGLTIASAVTETAVVTDGVVIGYTGAVTEQIPAGDPYFGYTTLLLHFEGTNGDQFTSDSSPSANTINFSLNPTISTAQALFGGSSLSFSGTVGNNEIDVANTSSEYDFGSGQFTLETAIRFNSTTGNQGIIGRWAGSIANQSWALFLNSGVLTFRFIDTGNTTRDVTYAWTFAINTWYRLAVDRDASGVVRLYVDGAKVASATNNQTIKTSGANVPIWLGAVEGFESTYYLRGYLDEVRVTTGVARYASDAGYVVATAAFPDAAIANDSSTTTTGNIYSVDDAETATVVDSAPDVGFSVAAAETATNTDVQDAGLAAVDDLTETATNTDTIDSIQVAGLTAAEAATVDETNDGALTYNDDVSDTQTVTATVTVSADRVADRSEAATATSTAKGVFVTALDTEEASVVDESSDSIRGGVSPVWEPFQLHDAVTSTWAGGVAADELAAVSDRVRTISSYGLDVAETAAPVDLPAGSLVRIGSIVEIASPDSTAGITVWVAATRSEATNPVSSAPTANHVGVVLNEQLAAVSDQILTQLEALASRSEIAIINALQAPTDYVLAIGEASFLWVRQGETVAEWQPEVLITAGVAASATVEAAIAAAASAEAAWRH